MELAFRLRKSQISYGSPVKTTDHGWVVMVSWAALTALADMGKKAAPLRDMVNKIDQPGFSPDERYEKYIYTRVIPRILSNLDE